MGVDFVEPERVGMEVEGGNGGCAGAVEGTGVDQAYAGEVDVGGAVGVAVEDVVAVGERLGFGVFLFGGGKEFVELGFVAMEDGDGFVGEIETEGGAETYFDVESVGVAGEGGAGAVGIAEDNPGGPAGELVDDVSATDIAAVDDGFGVELGEELGGVASAAPIAVGIGEETENHGFAPGSAIKRGGC